MTEDTKPVQEHVLSLLDVSSASVVLDLGCGRGEHLRLPARSVPEDVRLVGIDASDRSIEAARSATGGDPRFAFITHDLSDGIPFEDQTFDRGLSVNVLEAIPDKGALLGEVYRVLRPYGRVVVSRFDWDSQLYDGVDKALVRRVVHAFEHAAPLQLPLDSSFALRRRKLLIWDFDGTLAHRDGMWSGAMVEVLDRHEPGHGVTREQVRPYLRSGFPWHNADEPHLELRDPDAWWTQLQPVFASAYSAVGVSAHRAAVLADEVRRCYADPAAWSVYPDVPDALAQLRADGWTHVVLSNHIPELEMLMAALGLRAGFDAVYSSALIGYEKPNPHAFRHVLDAVSPYGPVWMIGDNPVADIAGAAAVGIPGILVRSDSEGAQMSCADLTGIRVLISERWR